MHLYSVLLAAVPWWAFLMMPLMMLGMGVMMWLMMRMMMGMNHGSSHGSPQPTAGQGDRAAESELDELRERVSELQERLAAMDADTGRQAPRPQEGEEP